MKTRLFSSLRRFCQTRSGRRSCKNSFILFGSTAPSYRCTAASSISQTRCRLKSHRFSANKNARSSFEGEHSARLNGLQSPIHISEISHRFGRQTRLSLESAGVRRCKSLHNVAALCLSVGSTHEPPIRGTTHMSAFTRIDVKTKRKGQPKPNNSLSS